MALIAISLPNGKDERVKEDSVIVVRELADIERRLGKISTESKSIIFTSSGTIYPALEASEVAGKLSGVKFAVLSAPNEMPLYVNAEAVTDRDDASKALDDPRTRSVLHFGSGKKAPAVRVRETEEELVSIWTRLGLPTEVLA